VRRELEQVRRPAILLLTVMVAASLLLAHPPQAAARTTLDAPCDQGAGATNLTGQKKYAESFTPKHSGKLTRVFVEPWNAGDYILQTWAADSSGLPTGSGPLTFTVVTNPHSGYEFCLSPSHLRQRLQPAVITPSS
jgi:hypothetical protein